MDTIAQVALLIIVVCSIVMRISLCRGNFIITALSLLLYLAFQHHNGTLNFIHENIIKQIPLIIEEALARFNLKCKTISYAICTCHCIYMLTYWARLTISHYFKHYTHHPRPETQCWEPLLHMSASGEHCPEKTFLYYDFNDYLTNLLLWHDIKLMMDQVFNDLHNSLSSPSPHLVQHPFETCFFWEFHGPKSKKLFALHVNFFNPQSMCVCMGQASH